MIINRELLHKGRPPILGKPLQSTKRIWDIIMSQHAKRLKMHYDMKKAKGIEAEMV